MIDIPHFQYVGLHGITYHILHDPKNIRTLLTKWIKAEWLVDQAPDQPWTDEWLTKLDHMTFELRTVSLSSIVPRADLMRYETPNYSFVRSLKRRADERQEAILRGVSIEPLLVDAHGMELMDGYTRYTVLQRFGITECYAYLGTRNTSCLSKLKQAS